MANNFKNLRLDARRKIQAAARQAAVEIMNDLAEKGPDWSGNFKNSWVADALGTGIGKKSSYPYSISDVPKLKDTIAATEKDTKYKIFNSSPYALYAMDLVEGEFFQPTPPPSDAREGSRRSGIRGDIGSGEGNFSTAELDWFLNYIDGGGLEKSLANGVRIGFRAEI